jgi:hypothetical protein
LCTAEAISKIQSFGLARSVFVRVVKVEVEIIFNLNMHKSQLQKQVFLDFSRFFGGSYA